MSEQQVARTAGAAALRGALLVGAAVLIGVLLLSKNDGILASAEEDNDSPETEIAEPGTTTSTRVTTPDTQPPATTPTTTSTTVASNLRNPADVRVEVSNGAFLADGSRVNGAAGAVADVLLPLNYNVVTVSNSDFEQPASAVYFVAGGGFQADAREIARQVGIVNLSLIHI